MITIAHDFQTNIIIGGRVSPTLFQAFSRINQGAVRICSLNRRVSNSASVMQKRFNTALGSMGKISKRFALIGGVIGGASLLGGKAMITQAANMEQYRSTLNVVMKDNKKAAQTFKWAVDFANKTPFETSEIVEATVKLTSYGVQAKKTLPLIGDMAGVMGKSIDQAVEAIADAQTGELERLKEFGITKQMIIDQGERKLRGIELVNQKGQITNQRAFNAALFSLMQDRYKGGMKIQARTYNGLMSTIKGIVKNGMGQIAGISATGEIIQGSMFDVIKEKALKLSDVLLKMQSNGTFEYLQKKLSMLVSNGMDKLVQKMPDIIAFGKRIIENAPKIFSKIGEGITVVGDLGGTVIKFGNYMLEHGPQIIDTVKFIGEGFLTWKAITGIANTITTINNLCCSLETLRNVYIPLLATKAEDKLQTIYLMGLYAKDAIVIGARTIATGALTIAQGALNIAMSIGTAIANAFSAAIAFLTSPIGLVIAAIAAVIGIVVLLYQNWDTVSHFLVGIWQDYVLPFFSGVVGFFEGIFDGIKGVFKGIVNTIINGVNFAIGAINSISFDVPDWVPAVGGKHFGINIPLIPTFAKGGIANQPSIFGEAGPEMAIPLQKGNPRSIQLLNQTSKLLGVNQPKQDSTQVINNNKNISLLNKNTEINNLTKSYISQHKLEFIKKEPRNISKIYNKDNKNKFSPIDKQGQIKIIYSPNITTKNNDSNLKDILLEDYERFKEFMNRYLEDKGRDDFGSISTIL